jgi:oligopeptide transport system substrate-binding protein
VNRGPREAARTPRRLGWLLVVALVALAGCTGGGSNDPGASNGTGGGAAPQGRTGGTLAIALLDPGPLDPARAGGFEDEVVLGNLFDGLTAIDTAGAVRPAVAASWSSDPALRRWEFRLRPEARWSDGSPLRASDFIFAWHRLADPKSTPRPPAGTLLSGVTGYRPFAAGRARSITGLQAPDPATLVIQLDHPFADLPALAAALPLSPLPADLVRPGPAAYLSQPVGNGPFRLAAPARPGRSLTLDRNPAYRGSPPLLDKVRVQIAPDEQTAWLELQNGRVSFAPVPPDQLPAARTVHGPSPDGRSTPGLLQGPTLTTWQLAFNLRSRLGSDPRWRRAFSLAIDRDQLATALAGSPAASLVPPATPGSGAGGAGAAPTCPSCDHDPATARALLSTVKASGTPVTLAIPPGPEARRVATLLAGDLTAAGLELAPDPAPPGEAPLTLARRVAPYPRPDPFLATPSSASPSAQRLLDQASATPDDPARATVYHQAEAAILADLTTIPLVTEHHAAVLTPGPQGFNLTPWNTLDLATVSLPA